MLESTKVLTPGRKPPKSIYADDTENKSPDLLKLAVKSAGRRSRSISRTPAKILTPKVTVSGGCCQYNR